MSTYTSKQARIRAALSEKVRDYVTIECRDTVDAIINGITSRSLHEEAERLRTTTPGLAETIERTEEKFARVERLVVYRGLSESLRDLGYALNEATGMSASAIEASRGHEKVLVVVKDGGEVTTDWAGLRDSTCIDRQAELTVAAAQHGIDLGETKASLHHDPRGGQSIAAAARHHGSSLAEGAVLEAEAHHAPRSKIQEKKHSSHVRARV